MRTLIRGGHLIDPDLKTDSILDLLTEDGRIAALLRPEDASSVRADRVIEARGRVVCPGFIDIHMHEDPVEDGSIAQCIFEAMLRMGVTTAVAGNCGENLYPPLRYLDLVDRDGTAVNVAMLAGHTHFRIAAGLRDLYAPASKEQISVIKDAVSEAIDGGCIGLSFGLRYVPGADTDEFLEVAQAAERSGCLISAHVRDDAAYVFDAVEEFAEAGRRYHVPLQVSHIGSMGGYGQMRELLAQIDLLRSQGLDITADCYPYSAFSTRIGASTYDEGWMERYHCGYDVIEMCEGKYKGMRCTKEMFEEMRRDFPMALTVCHVMQEEEVRLALRHPGVMLGSDGTLSGGQGHPRAAGAFPHFLSSFVRAGDLSLHEAIEKMTTAPARRLNLPNKGTLRPGADADIVIFDPETVRDRATFEEPLLPPDGIFDVLIGGETAVSDGQVVNDRLGRAVRRKRS